MSGAGVQRGGPGQGRPRDRDWLRVARQTHNPLLRPPVPGENLARRVGVVALALIALACLTFPVLVYRHGTAAERADAGRRPVTVTVVRELDASGDGYGSMSRVEVTYQVDGVTRVAQTPVLFGAPPGATLRAWVAPDGRLTGPPQTPEATVAQTALAVLGGCTLLVSLVLGGRGVLAAWVMHRRMREWEEAWRAFDTGRHRR